MSLEVRMKEAYQSLKAPEGEFAVCVWDPSNPEKSKPVLVRTKEGRFAIYTSRNYAAWYARIRNEQWFKEITEKKQRGVQVIGEADYFVIDYEGNRIY